MRCSAGAPAPTRRSYSLSVPSCHYVAMKNPHDMAPVWRGTEPHTRLTLSQCLLLAAHTYCDLYPSFNLLLSCPMSSLSLSRSLSLTFALIHALPYSFLYPLFCPLSLCHALSLFSLSLTLSLAPSPSPSPSPSLSVCQAQQ